MVYSVDEIARKLKLKPSTVLGKIRKGELGEAVKVPNSDGMWKLEDGAIEAYLEAKAEAKRKKAVDRRAAAKAKAKRDDDAYMYVPSFSPEECEALADSYTADFKKKHAEEHSRMDPEDADRRIRNYWNMQYAKLMATKKKVKLADVSDADKRIAYVAPVFLGDHLARMRDYDASYFISEWISYQDAGWDVDSNPVFRFLIMQIIDEQIHIRRLQSVISLHELGVDETLDKNLTSAQKRFSDLVKQLYSAKKAFEPTNPDDDTPDPLGSTGGDDPTSLV